MTFILTLDNRESADAGLLFKKVAKSLILAITEGRLATGDALPPTRELAQHLKVSRDTVVKAYEELVNLGYVETNRTRGTFVKAGLSRTSASRDDQSQAAVVSERLSSYGVRLLQHPHPHPTMAHLEILNFGAPAAQFLPLRRWGELIQKYSQSADLCYEPDDLGRTELREALAGFLNRTRAISCQPEDVAVFSQSQNALNLLVRLLADPGDGVIVEEPGFGGIRNLAEAYGLKLLPVPVDDDGLNINALRVSSEKIKLIYVTPAHHDPTGSVMSGTRRQSLLHFAAEKQAWIIEDDYDSNFNHANSAQPALKALEPEGNVIYLSTFWKLLYPLSAIGFCVLPQSLRTVFARSKSLSETYSNSLEHLALVEMLNDGYLERHIRKVQKIYGSRRRAFIAAMQSNFGNLIELPKESGAMHYLVRFTGKAASPKAESIVARAGKEAGINLLSSKYAYMTDTHCGEFMIDFASTDEETMSRLITDFAMNFKRSLADFSA